MVAGIEERHQAAEQERQAECIGEAAEAIVSGAEQLELTAAAVTRLDEQVERKAQRLKQRRQLSEQTDVGGVAESVLKDIDPELLERVRDRMAEDKAPEQSKQAQSKHQERPKQRQKKRDQGMEL